MRLAGALLCSALLGCGGPLGPDEVAGNYRLTTADAATLPYLLRARIECDELITGGMLTLTANGGFALRYDADLRCGAEVVVRPRETAGVFSLDGRRIRLDGATTAGPTRELELGFEPAVERLAE